MTHPCDRCDGMGEIYVHESLGGKSYLTRNVLCPDCEGTGAKRAEER